MSRLPNFFLAGAPKAGTTSIYHYLDQHPGVFMSAIKEPHYFAEEIREENMDPGTRRAIASENRDLRDYLAGDMRAKRFGGIVPEWNDYVRLFANARRQTALGEASVCYLWSPTAPARIAEKLPHAKILLMLRNPVDRAYSQYLHGLSSGAIRWTFREHVNRNLRHESTQISVHYPFLEFGLYAEQLARYRERFNGNMWVGFYDDFKVRPKEVMHEIFRFLGVAPDFTPAMEQRHLVMQAPRSSAVGWLRRLGIWQMAAGVTPSRLRPDFRHSLMHEPGAMEMQSADRRYLIDYYREDIAALADMTGRDLDKWLRTDSPVRARQ